MYQAEEILFRILEVKKDDYTTLFRECKTWLKLRGFTIVTIYDPSKETIEVQLLKNNEMVSADRDSDYNALFDVTASLMYMLETKAFVGTKLGMHYLTLKLSEDELIEEFSDYCEGVYERYILVAADDLINEIMSTAGVYFNIEEHNRVYYVLKTTTYLEDLINSSLRKHKTTPILTPYIAMTLIKDLAIYDKLDEFTNQKRDDLILYHHTFGRYIRNEFLYPNPEYKDMDLDDVSYEMIIGLSHICKMLKDDHIALYNQIKWSVKLNEGVNNVENT